MDWDQKKIIFGKPLKKDPMTEKEKDPLLDELEERILEGPVIFTPDEEFLKKIEERKSKRLPDL